jgi:hypothetical protein
LTCKQHTDPNHKQQQHVLAGLAKAIQARLLDRRAAGGGWRFDIDEYELYEQVGPCVCVLGG